MKSLATVRRREFSQLRARLIDHPHSPQNPDMGEIIIDHLTKKYGDFIALNDVSLTVRSGEIVGLLGPNGAGKSTMMKIIVGILRPSDGTVKISGIDIVANPEEAKRMVGYLPENPSLYTGLTVVEFLSFVGKIRGVEDSALRTKIYESLDTFSLKNKTDALLGSLSKGMKQKVAIIASTLHAPDVLVLDEPLTALDPKTQVFVNNWIASQGGTGTTVLLSTHNLDVVQGYATQIAIIDRGTIVTVGDLDDLREQADTGTDARLEEVFLKLTSDGD
jgi:ABC-2 type transport system ATP-binding protein